MTMKWWYNDIDNDYDDIGFHLSNAKVIIELEIKAKFIQDENKNAEHGLWRVHVISLTKCEMGISNHQTSSSLYKRHLYIVSIPSTLVTYIYIIYVHICKTNSLTCQRVFAFIFLHFISFAIFSHSSLCLSIKILAQHFEQIKISIDFRINTIHMQTGDNDDSNTERESKPWK